MTKVLAIATAPRLPNFIRVRGEMVPIAEFTDEELRAIGMDWTRRLIETAQKKREQSEKESKE